MTIFHTVLANLRTNALNRWRVCVAVSILCALSLVFVVSCFTTTTSTFAAMVSPTLGSHTSTQIHTSTPAHTSAHTDQRMTNSSSHNTATGTTDNKSTIQHKTETKNLHTQTTRSTASTSTHHNSSTNTSSSSGNTTPSGNSSVASPIIDQPALPLTGSDPRLTSQPIP